MLLQPAKIFDKAFEIGTGVVSKHGPPCDLDKYNGDMWSL